MFRNDSLAGDWCELVERLDRDQALQRWALDEPALRRVDSVEDLARLTATGANPARADRVLGALVRLASAAGGHDDDALLLVLHLLSDMVVPMAVQLADLSDDVLPVIVCELACQIGSIDPRRPLRGWATALKWLTRDAVIAAPHAGSGQSPYHARHVRPGGGRRPGTAGAGGPRRRRRGRRPCRLRQGF